MNIVEEVQGELVRRNNLECALDRYYPLVVEIVETVRAEMERAEAAGI